MHGKSSVAAPSFLQVMGEMAERIRAQDWAATSIQDPAVWPQPLQTLVNVMLGSHQPMFVAWGPERVLLYNDGYAALLGNRHPQALGQPFFKVWSDIRADVEPIMNRAFAGRSTHMDDLMLVMSRNGYREEAHFSFSYTPVRDEAEGIGGVFCACNEITQEVKARAALKAEEERLRELFQKAPGFMCAGLQSPDAAPDT